MVQGVKQLPASIENLDQMGLDTVEILKGQKPLIISVGYSGHYYLDFYLKTIEKCGVKKYDVANIRQSDAVLPEHREVEESSKPINPLGCYKTIIFDNSTRSFKSLAGIFKYVLPRCPKWGVYEVYAFIMVDENGGSNSTALPVYQVLKNPLPYKGPLHTLRERAPNIFQELDNEKLTKLISTWASSIHSSTSLKGRIDSKLLDMQKMLFNIRYRPPRPGQNSKNT